VDHFTVSTADDLAAAQPHRNVPASERENLLAYVRSLDGSAVIVEAPNAPAAVVTPTAGQGNPVRWPFAEFDIVFSTAVTGLSEEDLIVGGTAGATWAVLMPQEDGVNYRVRLGGFAGNGSVSLRLNIGAASAGGVPSRATLGSSVDYLSPVPVVDPLAALGDEFGDAATISNWQRLDLTEGWGANKLVIWDVDTARSGHMRLTPAASAWYEDFAGPYVFRTITGDFVATVQMDVSRRNGAAGRPGANYSFGGLMLRRPRAITNAGASPGSDWSPGTENSVSFNFGTADPVAQPNANQWQCIVTNTINSVSNFYSTIESVPLNENTVTLQIVRVGSTIVLLRQHPGGPWVIEQRFTRADFPATMQIGFDTATHFTAVSGLGAFQHNRTVSAAGTPDVVVDADWLRISTPSAALTPAALAALPVTGPFGPVQLLANTGAASNLGLAAAPAPVIVDGESYAAWLVANRSLEELADPAATDPGGDADYNGVANLLEFLGVNTLTLELPGPGSAQLSFTRNANARGATLIVEQTTDFMTWTPIATSTNGTALIGTATIDESSGAVRNVTLTTPVPEDRCFYRIRGVLQSHAP
jgi:hypothetical protein